MVDRAVGVIVSIFVDLCGFATIYVYETKVEPFISKGDFF
jgi:hypothetical protein